MSDSVVVDVLPSSDSGSFIHDVVPIAPDIQQMPVSVVEPVVSAPIVSIIPSLDSRRSPRGPSLMVFEVDHRHVQALML